MFTIADIGWTITLVLLVGITVTIIRQKRREQQCAYEGHKWVPVPIGFWCPRCKHFMKVDEDGL